MTGSSAGGHCLAASSRLRVRAPSGGGGEPDVDLQAASFRCATAPERRPRLLFRVVDVVSGRTLVDDAPACTTVRALASVDSIFDVLIFVWSADRTAWRQLTPGEHRILWNFRGD